MLIFTAILFTFFIIFQLFYIFIPLFTAKGNTELKKITEEKSISILVPAYNEENIILNCLQGILNVNYNNYEVIIINDGSNDSTFSLLNKTLNLEINNRKLTGCIKYEKIKEIYQSTLYPQIYVIDKFNGGKADSLNAGIDCATKDIVITLDADSILEPDSLNFMNNAFEDKLVLAAGGMVQISQGFYGNFLNPKPTFKANGLVRYQIIQYLTAFYLHKMTQSKFNSMTVISGAFGAFKRHALLEVNGYRKTVGEDMDITLRVQKLIKTKYEKHKLIFVPQAVCYTECPSTFKALWNQRIRWQKAFIDCIFIYKKAFFRELGFKTSIYLLVDSLALGTLNAFPTLIIPVMLVINNDNFIIVMALFTITFFLASYQSITAIMISRRYDLKYSRLDYFKMFIFLPIEIISYRFLGLLFVTVGTISFFKNKDSWNVSIRIGDNNQVYTGGIVLGENKSTVLEEVL